MGAGGWTGAIVQVAGWNVSVVGSRYLDGKVAMAAVASSMRSTLTRASHNLWTVCECVCGWVMQSSRRVATVATVPDNCLASPCQRQLTWRAGQCDCSLALTLVMPCETTIKPQRRASKHARRIFTISVLPFPFPVVAAAVSLVGDSSLEMCDKLQELIFLLLASHFLLTSWPPSCPSSCSAFHVFDYKTIFMTFSCLRRIYFIFVAHLCRQCRAFSSCLFLPLSPSHSIFLFLCLA